MTGSFPIGFFPHIGHQKNVKICWVQPSISEQMKDIAIIIAYKGYYPHKMCWDISFIMLLIYNDLNKAYGILIKDFFSGMQ